MKTFLILGGGTGGTMVANKMSHHLDPAEWKIIVVDENENHYYQPGLLFIPFGIYSPADVVKPKRDFYPQNVEFVLSKIEMIEPDQNRVKLEKGKRTITYDTLVIATGSRIAPGETPGLLDNGWHKDIFDFYTIEGATALRRFLKFWKGGRMVLNVAEMPIKCPVAPLEFLFLADWFFHERGIRDDVEIVFATPLSGAFTKPRASSILGDMLELGHAEEYFHEQIGSMAELAHVDALFTLGKRSSAIVKRARENEKFVGSSAAFTSSDELLTQLQNFIQSGDCVLFKASRLMKFENLVEPLAEQFSHQPEYA